jgi:nitrite reductase/ring-hydroxylating ferredoxin subunit
MFQKVCPSDSLMLGGVRLFDEGDDVNIAIFKRENGLFAIDNTCPHAGADLHYGKIEKGYVLCPFHAWRFHIETGRCAIHHKFNLKTYQVKDEDGWVWVDPDSGVLQSDE